MSDDLTLAQAQARGLRVEIVCGKCGHISHIPPAMLIRELGLEYLVRDVGPHGRCQQCHAKQATSGTYDYKNAGPEVVAGATGPRGRPKG